MIPAGILEPKRLFRDVSKEGRELGTFTLMLLMQLPPGGSIKPEQSSSIWQKALPLQGLSCELSAINIPNSWEC